MQGMDVGQAITSRGATVSLQDISETAARFFAVRWKIVSCKSKSKVDFVDRWERHGPTFLLHLVFFVAFSVPDQCIFPLVRVAKLCAVVRQLFGAYNPPFVQIFSFHNTAGLVGNSKVILRANTKAVALGRTFSPVPISKRKIVVIRNFL